MGLAASQARLLMITCRVTDCQYDLMKLSGDTMKLNAESSDIDEQYDWKLHAIDMSYKGNSDFGYGDIMGQAGLTAGNTTPAILTNSSNKVVFDSNMANIAEKAGMPNNGGTKSDEAFAKFMKALTGDDSTNWVKTLRGTTSTTIPPSAPDLSADYAAAKLEFTKKYGEEPPAKFWVSTGDSVDQGVIDNSYNYHNELGNNIHISQQPKVNEKEDFKFAEDGYFSEPINSKGYTRDQWRSHLQTFAAQKGLNYSNLLNGTLPKPPKPLITTTPPDKTSDNYKKANYYYQIYSEAATKGWAKDDKVNNREYLKAQLENNNYKINGKIASENSDITSEAISETKKSEAKDWYERESKKISKQEKQIDTKQTQIQTQLMALTTEEQSVQSMIDKNIERSFTYCNA